MPPLYRLDNYDRCFHHTNPTYCLVRADMVPNKSSDLWNQIEDFSVSVGHFEHNQMTYGMCVSTCQEIFDKTDNATSFYNGILTDQPLVHFQTTKVFKSHDHYRRKYNKLLNICINIHTSRTYGLNMKSNILYCDSDVDIPEAEAVHSTDYWNLTFYLITGIIVFMTILASFSRIDSNVIRSFSLSRNWQRLMKEDASDFKQLSAIKFFLQVGVIYAHSVWIVALGPILNPEFFETKSYWNMLIIVGPTTLSSFYVFTNYLLALRFLEHMRLNKDTKLTVMFIGAMGHRVIRIISLYAFMVLFQGLNIWPNVIAPMFKFHIDREMYGCREAGWTNLLFVNNIFKMSESVSIRILISLISSILQNLFLVYVARMVLSKRYANLHNMPYTIDILPQISES